MTGKGSISDAAGGDNRGGRYTSEFSFTCTSCGKPLQISGQYRGRTVKCPYCSAVVVAGSAAQAAPEGSGTYSLNEPTVRCPFCGQDVGASAVQCSHCGNLLRQSQPSYVDTRPPKTCGWAIASLILGCVPLTCFPSVIAIIFGHIAMAKIGSSGGRLKGRGLATAGLTLGYGFTLINLIYVCMTMGAKKP